MAGIPVCVSASEILGCPLWSTTVVMALVRITLRFDPEERLDEPELATPYVVDTVCVNIPCVLVDWRGELDVSESRQ
jgi:hypothetical protein